MARGTPRPRGAHGTPADALLCWSSGRLAQRESASFTPKRSLVRSQYRPPASRRWLPCGSHRLLLLHRRLSNQLLAGTRLLHPSRDTSRFARRVIRETAPEAGSQRGAGLRWCLRSPPSRDDPFQWPRRRGPGPGGRRRRGQDRASHHEVPDAVSVPRVVGGVLVRPVFAVATRKLAVMPALANEPPIWLLPRAKFGSVVPLA